MKAPKPPAPPPRLPSSARGVGAARTRPLTAGVAPTRGSGLTAHAGELDALRALEAVLGLDEFWTPRVLGQFNPEVVSIYIDAVVGDHAVNKDLLSKLRALAGHPMPDRARRAAQVPRIISDERVARAVLVASGVPWEIARNLEEGYGPSLLKLSVKSNFRLESLPEGLPLQMLDVPNCLNLETLPTGLNLTELDAEGSGLRYLPSDLVVTEICDLSGCMELTRIPASLQPLQLFIRESGISELPEGLERTIGLDMRSCHGIRALPPGLQLEWLQATDTDLEMLPMKTLESIRYLDIAGCSEFKALPEGLSLETLDIRWTGHFSLPGDLQVRSEFYVEETPFARLSDTEIRAMAPGVTGEILR